jgi:DNA-binding transcriptional regulator YiaG
LGNLDSLLDNRIEGKVESAVASLREELALLRLKVERLSQEDERLRPEVQPISPKPPETETDIDNSGLTTTQLARELGVAHSQISRWRSGERKPSDPAIAEKFSQWEFDEESKRWYRREDTTVN